MHLEKQARGPPLLTLLLDEGRALPGPQNRTEGGVMSGIHRGCGPAVLLWAEGRRKVKDGGTSVASPPPQPGTKDRAEALPVVPLHLRLSPPGPSHPPAGVRPPLTPRGLASSPITVTTSFRRRPVPRGRLQARKPGVLL